MGMQPMGLKPAFAFATANSPSARQQQTKQDARTARNVFFFSKTGGSCFDPTYYRSDGTLKSDAEFYNAAFNALPPEVRKIRAGRMEWLRVQIADQLRLAELKRTDPVKAYKQGFISEDDLTPWQRFLAIWK